MSTSLSHSPVTGTTQPVTRPRTTAHVVGHEFARAGVDRVFGVTGSGNFVATSALIDAGATFVAARHEAGAVTMADGYARTTGKVGLASVHQGPGLTNALTGLVEAVKSRTPLVLLTGDTSDGATRSNFYIPQAQVTESLGAGAERLTDPADAAGVVARAVRRAAAERRPIVLNLPLDVQQALATTPWTEEPESRADSRPRLEPEPEALDRLLEAIGKARRPLILAGRGVSVSGSKSPVEELRERLGALLATTAAAHGLFAGNPHSLGICGGFASPEVARLVADADLVIGLGVSYTKWTTRHGHAFGSGAVVVQVDHDPAALGSDARVDLALQGDVTATVRALLDRIPHRRPDALRWDVAVGEDVIARSGWGSTPFEDDSTGDLIDPRALSLRLESLVPAERTVVIDGGHFVGFPSMYWSVPDPAGYLFTGAGFQSIGLGLGTAIGAAIGNPARTVVLAIGDGGLHMSLAELDTLARLHLPVLVVIYNDAAYGAEVHHYKDSGADLGLVRFPDTDFARLAAGFGVEGATIRTTTDLDIVTTWLARGDRGPLVLDCKVVPTVVADYQAEAFIGH